jgi:hypothetical protein
VGANAAAISKLPGSLCRPAKPSQVVGQSGVPEMGPLHTDDCLQRGQPVLRAVALSDRNGPAERYDRVGCDRPEQVIEFDDPVQSVPAQLVAVEWAEAR